jgi:tetratricopeptide (TPR) repeat protein
VNQRQLREFLSLLPDSNEIWQCGVVPISQVLAAHPADAPDLKIVAWRSASTDLVHVVPTEPDADDLSILLEAMLEFWLTHEFSFRPARIECNARELAGGLNAALQGPGTTVAFVPEMPEWDAVLKELAEHFDAEAPLLVSLIDAGCDVAHIREYADAAAAFYRAELWNYLDDVDLIKLESPEAPQLMKYVVVLGAGSYAYGLGFYDDEEIHYDIMSDRSAASEVDIGSMTFHNAATVNSADVDLWADLHLPLETDDAFPVFDFFLGDGPRRPTPDELEFATIVLKALAATSEHEIDTGRWTKSIEFFGRTLIVELSIPNLLDPPDRQEWIRRGLEPESRSNEWQLKLAQEFIQQHSEEVSLDELNAELNARFTGPMSEYERPMETPADRAEAFCQQAIETFGRRRIQLTMQALAEDATHVEANILLAESTRQLDTAIERFRHAKSIAAVQLGSIMDEAAGHFWALAETRPFMRATLGLADVLHQAGQTHEAILMYQELLRLNPNDNQGARYQLMPLLLVNNRDAEVAELLDSYNEPTAHWHYMKSLVEFRRGRNSATARRAMRAAFRANEHLVPLLQDPGPAVFPDSYELGSPDEAANCIEELTEAWAETDGYFDWMFSEYSRREKDKVKQMRARKGKQKRQGKRKRKMR